MNPIQQIAGPGARLALMLLALALVSAPARSRQHESRPRIITLINTLAGAGTTTRFRAAGAGGMSISKPQFIGPEFTLAKKTIITEIGAFVNLSSNMVNGVAEHFPINPIDVQIRPSKNGAPDPSHIIATYRLSNDGDPDLISFESVEMSLELGPGTYYALFAPQGGDNGYVMGSASHPFEYRSKTTRMGMLNNLTGEASTGSQYGAVRMLGVSAAPD